jgi:hypothetical protein
MLADTVWSPDGERELKQDPVLRAQEGAVATPNACCRAWQLTSITVDTLYDAKAHYGRNTDAPCRCTCS